MSGDLKNSLSGFKEQVVNALSLGMEISFSSVNKVLICGMGGSSLPGEFIKSLFYPLSFELIINKDYIIPDFINEDYLCFCISYSGNTEETIQMYKEVIKKTGKVVVLSSGGELETLSMKNKTRFIKLPPGLPPRMATAYMTMPLINVMTNSGVTNFNLELETRNSKSVLDYNYERKAKLLSAKLKNSIILVYASNNNEFSALKWKISFNENSKAPAFYNIFPEWNHNELNGFNNKSSKFTALFLTDEQDHVRVRKRFRVVAGLLRKKNVRVIIIALEGKSRFSKLLFSSIFADWVSYELAKIYKEDAFNVPVIEDLKNKLEE